MGYDYVMKKAMEERKQKRIEGKCIICKIKEPKEDKGICGKCYDDCIHDFKILLRNDETISVDRLLKWLQEHKNTEHHIFIFGKFNEYPNTLLTGDMLGKMSGSEYLKTFWEKFKYHHTHNIS